MHFNSHLANISNLAVLIYLVLSTKSLFFEVPKKYIKFLHHRQCSHLNDKIKVAFQMMEQN